MQRSPRKLGRSAASQVPRKHHRLHLQPARQQQRVSVQVGASGLFSVPLLPGQYQVAARSPDIETVDPNGRQQEQTCSLPLSATVTAGQTITLAVTCVVP